MTIRPTQSSIFALVSRGLFENSARLFRAQEQASSGKRILRPSDDPIGTVEALGHRAQIAASRRYQDAIARGRELLDGAAAGLSEATELLNDARSTLVQGLNGSLSAEDRQVLAGEIREIRERMLALANRKDGERYVFGGTATLDAPFAVGTRLGITTVSYAGAADAPELLIGNSDRIAVGLPGDAIFAASEPGGARYAGLTGAHAGTSADQGSGYLLLRVHHDATSGTLGAGVAFANGGASDTLLGAHALSIDAVAGTIQLDNGQLLALPQPTDPGANDFTVTNEHGAELHLDLTGYTGGSLSATVSGSGSISLDGTNWTAMSLTETDLELADPASGTVLHVDTTAIHRAGEELVAFGGAVNVFDVLQGVADDLENGGGLATADQVARLELWLDELDHDQGAVIAGASALGAKSEHLIGVGARLAGSELAAQSLLSAVEDADYSQVVLDMARAEQSLQLAQATSARLLSSSLLDFLR